MLVVKTFGYFSNIFKLMMFLGCKSSELDIAFLIDSSDDVDATSFEFYKVSYK